MNLGGLQEELGDMTAAELAFRTALEKQSSFALPHARLATLLRSKLPEADLAALEERLKDEKLAETPRARLLFALAHALDGKGDFARAAECLRDSNALTLETNRTRKDYTPADHERFVDGLVRVFDRELFARLSGAGSETKRPVFVFGLPRSGTTLVEQVLASHTQVHGAGELRLARRSFEAIPAILGRSGAARDNVAFLDRTAVIRLAESHLEKLAVIDGGSARVVDKMPDNYMYIGLLSIMFPRATFIHCRRDLRDIAVSCWMTDFRSIRWSNDQTNIATRFQQYHRVMNHWKEVLPVPILEVNYEDTVTTLEAVTARQMLEACEAPAGSGLPRFPSHRAADSHRQRDAGAPARLSALGGPLEELRGSLVRAFCLASAAAGAAPASELSENRPSRAREVFRMFWSQQSSGVISMRKWVWPLFLLFAMLSPARAGSLMLTESTLPSWNGQRPQRVLTIGVTNTSSSAQVLYAWQLGLVIAPQTGATGTLEFASAADAGSNDVFGSNGCPAG